MQSSRNRRWASEAGGSDMGRTRPAGEAGIAATGSAGSVEHSSNTWSSNHDQAPAGGVGGLKAARSGNARLSEEDERPGGLLDQELDVAARGRAVGADEREAGHVLDGIRALRMAVDGRRG